VALGVSLAVTQFVIWLSLHGFNQSVLVVAATAELLSRATSW